jgi:hypothetical protein
MNQTLYKKVVDQIYRRYPEFKGAKPRVRIQKPGDSNSQMKENYLFTFQKTVTLGENKSLARWVRVVVNSQGKVLKVSTSR